MAYGYGMDTMPTLIKGQPRNAPPPPLPDDWINQAGTTTDRGQWFDLKRLYQQQPGRF